MAGCFSNYHTEHHDFPDIPAFRLRELRDTAASFYDPETLDGAEAGWWKTMERTFRQREFYACSGVLERRAIAEKERVGNVGRSRAEQKEQAGY